MVHIYYKYKAGHLRRQSLFRSFFLKRNRFKTMNINRVKFLLIVFIYIAIQFSFHKKAHHLSRAIRLYSIKDTQALLLVRQNNK